MLCGGSEKVLKGSEDIFGGAVNPRFRVPYDPVAVPPFKLKAERRGRGYPIGRVSSVWMAVNDMLAWALWNDWNVSFFS